MKNKKNAVDLDIEQAYYKHAQGMQIGIMDIGKLYNDARAAVASGEDVEAAVVKGVEKYCQPA